jgi:hypothetical protein
LQQRLFHNFAPQHIYMPSLQNRSNGTFRVGFLRLAAIPTAKSGFKKTVL